MRLIVNKSGATSHQRKQASAQALSLNWTAAAQSEQTASASRWNSKAIRLQSASDHQLHGFSRGQDKTPEIELKVRFGTFTNLRAWLTAAAINSIPIISNASSYSTPENSNSNFGTALLIAWFFVVAIGASAGWRKSITVFRNYDDLALVFFLGLDVIAAFFLLWAFGQENHGFSAAVAIIGLLGFIGLSIIIVVRTWIDNPSILWFPIALITKISLAALFLINLFGLVKPGGKTQVQRSKSRADALGWLLIITPIIVRLVRNNEGLWAPKDVMNKYQRGKLGL